MGSPDAYSPSVFGTNQCAQRVAGGLAKSFLWGLSDVLLGLVQRIQQDIKL